MAIVDKKNCVSKTKKRKEKKRKLTHKRRTASEIAIYERSKFHTNQNKRTVFSKCFTFC
jgi:hypothetical protein